MWAIGDVHGKIKEYENILKKIHQEDEEAYTIQVGDMGVGFANVLVPNVGPKDFWIAGNHDDAVTCERQKGNLKLFGLKKLGQEEIFYVSGAESIDKHLRTPGISWWPYEEMNYEQLQEAIYLFNETKPKIVVSHDCPFALSNSIWGIKKQSRTNMALEQMLECHAPDLWIFGHHHRSLDKQMFGTRFVCLTELEFKRFN